MPCLPLPAQPPFWHPRLPRRHRAMVDIRAAMRVVAIRMEASAAPPMVAATNTAAGQAAVIPAVAARAGRAVDPLMQGAIMGMARMAVVPMVEGNLVRSTAITGRVGSMSEDAITTIDTVDSSLRQLATGMETLQSSAEDIGITDIGGTATTTAVSAGTGSWVTRFSTIPHRSIRIPTSIPRPACSLDGGIGATRSRTTIPT